MGMIRSKSEDDVERMKEDAQKEVHERLLKELVDREARKAQES